MTVNELYARLCERIPASLSCSWDNDGLMCCPDGSREVRAVLIALDVTGDTVRYAAENGYDVIISHHPFIFKGLKAVSNDNFVAAKAIDLIRNGISVMSFHTRLDAVNGGVNDILAKLLELKDTEPLVNGDEAIGRIGELDSKTALSLFAKKVKCALGAPCVLYADSGKPVKRVAVLGGEGGDDIAAAIASGADTYVSGRLGYHNMTDAPEMGINLIEAGHFYTEDPVCSFLAELVSDIDGSIRTEKYFSGRIAAV